MMKLLPIAQHLHQNTKFASDEDCKVILDMTLDFYKRVGFAPPWICYFVEYEGTLVGSAGIKGQPVNNKIEIAYGVFPNFQNQGLGNMICKSLVDLTLNTDPKIVITARTLPEENYSVQILRKNNFKLLGEVVDPEDGIVWEWEFQKEYYNNQ